MALDLALTLKMNTFVPCLEPRSNHLVVEPDLVLMPEGGQVRQNVASVNEYSESLVFCDNGMT